ncbi:hypothetical protein I4U23_017002 [Adineta vaga]|nr:hypothetical protein I4U23_017002 [Adineta vaga]
MYCQLQTDTGLYNGFTIINEPSILRLPCGNTLSCSGIKLTSSSCTGRNFLIKSSDTEQYVQLQTIPWSLKNMNKQLFSTHQSIIKNSFRTLLDDLKENRLTIKTQL